MLSALVFLFPSLKHLGCNVANLGVEESVSSEDKLDLAMAFATEVSCMYSSALGEPILTLDNRTKFIFSGKETRTLTAIETCVFHRWSRLERRH